VPSEQRAYDMTPRRPLRARRSRARSAPGAAASHGSAIPTVERAHNLAAPPRPTAHLRAVRVHSKAIDGRGWGWDLRIGAGGCTWRPVPPHLLACQLRLSSACAARLVRAARARARRQQRRLEVYDKTRKRDGRHAQLHGCARHCRQLCQSAASRQSSQILRRRSCAPSQPHTTVAG
jgi:hypothetical protein